MRKFNHKFSTWIFSLIILFLLLLILPSKAISAQSQNEAPDFIVTLALMALADDRMDGVMDTAALLNLRAVVDEYYTNKNLLRMDADTAAALNHQKQVVLSELDKKINNQKTLTYRAQVGLFIAMADSTNDIYINDPKTYGDPYDFYNGALSGGYEPDSEILDMLRQRLSNDTQTALQDNLNGHLAESVDNGDALIQQSTDKAYDFSAGDDSRDSVSEEEIYKPLLFINMGGKDVRVMVEYYEPPIGISASASHLDTIVPGDTEEIHDGFPMGSYVFCFDWETSLDTNDDGVKDYDRAIVHGWISERNSIDDLMFNAVYVNAMFSPTPTGRCDGFKGEAPSTETLMTEVFMAESDSTGLAVIPTDEADSPQETATSSGADFWDQDDDVPTDDDIPTKTEEPYTGLTPAELANQGEHNYEMTCQNMGLTDTRAFTASWNFTDDGVLSTSGSFYNWIAPNTYQNEYGTTITFTLSGYLANSFYTETDSEGKTTTTETACVATFQ